MRKKKIKVAYALRLSLDRMDGIGRKVRDQILAWCEAGVDARLLAFVNVDGDGMNDVCGWRLILAPDRTCMVVRKIQRTIQFLKGAAIIVFWRPDIIYTRAGNSHWGSFLWKFSGAKRVIELNATIESEVVSLLRVGQIDERESHARRQVWKQSMLEADGYVSVSYEIQRQNKEWMGDKPHTVVWNSIDFSKYDSVTRTNSANELPKIVFVGAADYEWNGLDKILDLAGQTVGLIEYVVIGVWPSTEVPENVEVHPFLDKEELPRVLSSCDVGMATLALHRKGLEEASPLKVREYAALGIPMIVSYDETPFHEEAMPAWILRIPNSETSITESLRAIITFADNWKGKAFDRDEARSFFHAEIVEQRRTAFFDKIK